MDNVMPSLFYESKASFLQRLTDFYGVSTVTNQITSQPCHVAQLSPLQEIQEFQVSCAIPAMFLKRQDRM